MIPYILFLFLVLFFRVLKRPQYIYITLLVFNVLRYDTGWDYMSYISLVENWGMPGSNMLKYSFIWQWLFSFAERVNIPHLALAIPGFLTVSLVYFAISKLLNSQEAICDSLCIYAFWPYFYLGSFSTVRQALGVAIALVILYSAVHRKLVLFLLLLVLDYFIHPSSIVCVFYVAFFFPYLRVKLWQMGVLFVAFYVALSFIDLIIQGSPLAVYETYLNSSDTYGSKLSILLAIMLIPTFMVRNIEKGAPLMADFCVMSIVLQIMTFVAFNSSVLSRVSDYYAILLVFVASKYKNLFQEKQLGNILVLSAFISVFIYYLVSTRGAASQGLATSPFVPYKFIFWQ